MDSKPQMRLVYVEWLDSHSVAGGGWNPPEQITATAAEPMIVHTVGWVFSETPERVTIVPHVSGSLSSPDELSGDIVIPRGAIRLMENIFHGKSPEEGTRPPSRRTREAA